MLRLLGFLKARPEIGWRCCRESTVVVQTGRATGPCRWLWWAPVEPGAAAADDAPASSLWAIDCIHLPSVGALFRRVPPACPWDRLAATCPRSFAHVGAGARSLHGRALQRHFSVRQPSAAVGTRGSRAVTRFRRRNIRWRSGEASGKTSYENCPGCLLQVKGARLWSHTRSLGRSGLTACPRAPLLSPLRSGQQGCHGAALVWTDRTCHWPDITAGS